MRWSGRQLVFCIILSKPVLSGDHNWFPCIFQEQYRHVFLRWMSSKEQRLRDTWQPPVEQPSLGTPGRPWEGENSSFWNSAPKLSRIWVRQGNDSISLALGSFAQTINMLKPHSTFIKSSPTCLNHHIISPFPFTDRLVERECISVIKA